MSILIAEMSTYKYYLMVGRLLGFLFEQILVTLEILDISFTKDMIYLKFIV
jgi:hypothetical protein